MCYKVSTVQVANKHLIVTPLLFFLLLIPIIATLSAKIISATTQIIIFAIEHNGNGDSIDIEIKEISEDNYRKVCTKEYNPFEVHVIRMDNFDDISSVTFYLKLTIKSSDVSTIIPIRMERPVSLFHSGMSVNTPLIATKEMTITLEARTDSGTPKTVGGDVIFVNITNACNRGKDMFCYQKPRSENMISNPVAIWMEDKGDGSYVAKYTLEDKAGDLSLSFYKMQNGALLGECYEYTPDDQDLVYYDKEYYESIDYPSWIVPECVDKYSNIMINFITKVYVPQDVTVNFKAEGLSIDNNLYFSEITETPIGWAITKQLKKDYMHDLKFQYHSGTENQAITFKWDLSSPGSHSTVPSRYLWYPVQFRALSDIIVQCRDQYYKSPNGVCASKS